MQIQQESASQLQLKIQRVQEFVNHNQSIYRNRFQQVFPFTQQEATPRFSQVDPQVLDAFYDQLFNYKEAAKSPELEARVFQTLQKYLQEHADLQFTFDQAMSFFYSQILSDQRISIEIKTSQRPPSEARPNQFTKTEEEEPQQRIATQGQLSSHQQKQEISLQQPHVQRKITYDQRQLEMRLKNIYDYYCRQVQNVGYAVTFDKIAKECQIMSASKLMQFCNSYGLLNDKLTSQVSRKIFKQIGNSLKQINFQQFKLILAEFGKVQFDKAADPVSLFFQKMGLTSQKQYRKRLKSLNIPVTANKMVPLDKQHHQRMLQQILEKRKKQLADDGGQSEQMLKKRQKIMQLKKKREEERKKGGGKQIVKSKQKLDTKKETQQNLIQNLLLFDQEDDFYLRQYRLDQGKKGLNKKLKAGQSVVDDTKRRARQQSEKEKAFQKKLKVI